MLAALWAAAAQAIAVLIPESGVPQLAFNVFFLIGVFLLPHREAGPESLVMAGHERAHGASGASRQA